jgi:hypothetical protein
MQEQKEVKLVSPYQINANCLRTLQSLSNNPSRLSEVLNKTKHFKNVLI